MERLAFICIGIIFIQFIIGMRYRRQIKKICRQMSFLKKHDSNMMIQTEIRYGNIGELADLLNEGLIRRREEQRNYLKKEAMISDTYTNLSHDIRTPLTSLDGYFQLLEESKSENEQKKYLGIIQERIGSLKEMLEELFLFTKIKNDSYQLELSDVCINTVLQQTIFSYYDEWTREGIEPKIELLQERFFVTGNGAAMRRIFQNIIKNGLDHGTNQISVKMTADEEKVYLKISNEVRNPEEIDITQVFKRFYKENTARSKTSSGLGLSIAKELAVRMNAELTAGLEKNHFYIEAAFFIREKSESKLTDCRD